MSLFPRPPDEPERRPSVDPLRSMVADQVWPDWPTRFETGLAASLRARGAKAIGHTINNLTVMRKRLEVGRTHRADVVDFAAGLEPAF